MITLEGPFSTTQEEFERAWKILDDVKVYKFPRIYFHQPIKWHQKRIFIKRWSGKFLLPYQGVKVDCLYLYVEIENEFLSTFLERIIEFYKAWQLNSRKPVLFSNPYLDLSINKVHFTKHYCMMIINT